MTIEHGLQVIMETQRLAEANEALHKLKYSSRGSCSSHSVGDEKIHNFVCVLVLSK